MDMQIDMISVVGWRTFADMSLDSRHLIEVKVSGTKGLSVFAIVNIPRGTRVLAETGLL